MSACDAARIILIAGLMGISAWIVGKFIHQNADLLMPPAVAAKGTSIDKARIP